MCMSMCGQGGQREHTERREAAGPLACEGCVRARPSPSAAPPPGACWHGAGTGGEGLTALHEVVALLVGQLLGAAEAAAAAVGAAAVVEAGATAAAAAAAAATVAARARARAAAIAARPGEAPPPAPAAAAAPAAFLSGGCTAQGLERRRRGRRRGAARIRRHSHGLLRWRAGGAPHVEPPHLGLQVGDARHDVPGALHTAGLPLNGLQRAARPTERAQEEGQPLLALAERHARCRRSGKVFLARQKKTNQVGRRLGVASTAGQGWLVVDPQGSSAGPERTRTAPSYRVPFRPGIIYGPT